MAAILCLPVVLAVERIKDIVQVGMCSIVSKIIGIDVGGSTTKIIGYDQKKLFSPLLVKANDPVASIYGAFGRFLNENKLQLSEIDRIMVTGVGSTFIDEKIFGIPTHKIDEFMAIGLGGLFLSKLDKAIIVSMGTGTAYVMAERIKLIISAEQA